MGDSLNGKTFLVTGTTSGIGLAAAENLVRRGADLIGVGRSPERCQQAEKRLQALAPQGKVAYCVADLSIQAQVRELAGDIRNRLASWKKGYLDGLVNDAGTFTFWLTLTPEGFETQWAVNHLAPFLLTLELLPSLQAAPAGRVVTVSSGSHYRTRLHWDDIQLRKRYNCLLAYKQTKLANVLFTAELNRRLGSGSRVRAFAADPGLVKTEIGFKGNPGLARWIWERRSRSGISPEQSAEGVVFLATEPSIQNSSEIYWKHSKPRAPSPEALDEEAARRLWEMSAQMCGLKPGDFAEGLI
jgi:NAD(P)-dependent dehydrogenase (short-subunit alcohol dehydrogenase family)